MPPKTKRALRDGLSGVQAGARRVPEMRKNILEIYLPKDAQFVQDNTQFNDGMLTMVIEYVTELDGEKTRKREVVQVGTSIEDAIRIRRRVVQLRRQGSRK